MYIVINQSNSRIVRINTTKKIHTEYMNELQFKWDMHLRLTSLKSVVRNKAYRTAREKMMVDFNGLIPVPDISVEKIKYRQARDSKNEMEISNALEVLNRAVANLAHVKKHNQSILNSIKYDENFLWDLAGVIVKSYSEEEQIAFSYAETPLNVNLLKIIKCKGNTDIEYSSEVFNNDYD